MLLFGACSEAKVPAGTADSGAAVDLADLTAARDLYQVDAVHRIDITIAAAEWQRFLAEHRDLVAAPTWHKADLRFDGAPLTQVGFKTFGYGSRAANPDKPNLNLEFDRYVSGQQLAGHTRLRAKNNGQDVSGLRQVITYEALRDTGLWAPRTSFASLYVNGESYGFYTLEEPFTKAFVRERGSDDSGAAYEAGACQGFVPPAVGGCDKLPDAYTRPFNAAAGAELVALCKALSGPSAQVLGALDALIDVDAWARAIAADLALAGDNDGFSTAGTNFRLYQDPGSGKLRLVITGPDTSYDPTSLPSPDPLKPAAAAYCAPVNPAYHDQLLQALTSTAAGLDRYRAAVRALRQGSMAPTHLQERVDALWAVIGAAVTSDPRRSRDSDPGASVDQIGAFLQRRAAQLVAAGL